MSEIDLFTSPFLLSLFISLSAGVLSFLSPCVLPIVPAYIAYMAGISLQDVELNEKKPNRRVFYSSIAFVLGLSTVFIVLGAAVSFVGQFLLSYQNILEIIAGFIIILFGLNFIGILSLGFGREFRFEVTRLKGGILVSYILGLAFAFGWTPCIGPILGSILALASIEETLSRAVILLISYSLGLAVPFVLSGYLIQRFLLFSKNFKKNINLISKIGGITLLVTGILILTNQLQAVGFYIIEIFPFMQKFG